MVQRRGGARFPLEALQRLAIAGELGGQKLQGELPAQLGVFGLVDHAHAAASELLEDAVVRNGLAGHRRGRCYENSLLGKRFQGRPWVRWAKARWFQSLSLRERMECLWFIPDLVPENNTRIVDLRNAQPLAGRIRVISRPGL
jgi:hypothetical protein